MALMLWQAAVRSSILMMMIMMMTVLASRFETNQKAQRCCTSGSSSTVLPTRIFGMQRLERYYQWWLDRASCGNGTTLHQFLGQVLESTCRLWSVMSCLRQEIRVG
jgi:hypothetical protein